MTLNDVKQVGEGYTAQTLSAYIYIHNVMNIMYIYVLNVCCAKRRLSQ